MAHSMTLPVQKPLLKTEGASSPIEEKKRFPVSTIRSLRFALSMAGSFWAQMCEEND